MRTIILIGTAAIMALALFNLSGCNDDPVDQSAPVIEVSDPVMNEIFAAGSSIPFKARFEDNMELGTYNIEIHDDFDGHSHGRIAARQTDPSLQKWYYDESFEIPEGKSVFDVDLENEIAIPENTLAGPYHFIVQAIDKAGNATAFDDDSSVELSVFISNTTQPQITITNLDAGELHLEEGVLFIVTGEASDATTGTYAGMHAIDVVLGPESEDDQHSHGGRIADENLIEASFEDEQLASLIVDGKIILDKVFEGIGFIPTKTQIDELIADELEHLSLKILVHDEQGNIAISLTPVHL